MGMLLLDNVVKPATFGTLLKQTFRASPWVFLYFSWCWVMAWFGLTKSAEAFFAFRNVFPSFVVFALMATSVRNAEQVRTILWIVVAGAIVNLALGIAQKTFGGPYPNALHASVQIKMDLEGQFIRNSPTGFFVHPNGLAVFLIPISLFLLYSTVFLYRNIGMRVVCGLLLLVTMAVQWVTYTKGAVLWAVVAMALAFLPKWSARSRNLIGWTVLLGIIGGIVFLSTERVFVGWRALNSMTTRVEIWTAALNAITANMHILIFGNGFREVYFETLRVSELAYLNAHNTVLNQVIFFGLPALSFYVLAFSRATSLAAKTAELHRSPDVRRLSWYCYCALVGLVGEHFFEPVLDSVVLQAQFYLLLGLTHALSRMRAECA